VPAKPVANRAMIAQEPANPTEATETPSPLVFWIPRPPDNANARGHSRQANRTMGTSAYRRSTLPGSGSRL
jgi:hypothetical protein